jgi:hypothetical protein
MSAEFIAQYISDAVSNNTSPIEVAKLEIQEIDRKLNEAENLKLRRMLLVSVLDQLGDDTYKRRRASATPSSDDIDISCAENRELSTKICDVILEFGSVSVRDLVRKVGGYDQDSLIMRVVKFLGDQEIVSRDVDGKVQPGKNWEMRVL